MTNAARDARRPPGSDPLAGTTYRMVRSLGAGAMGQVLEAEHTGLRRRVAVKLLAPALAGDPMFVDRLRLEAQALAAVRHPNVVLIHDHATTPAGVPFLVMELLHGRTLQEVLSERGSLPLPEALHLMDQILGGLSAIHAAGLTHRDLKPANIFLSAEGGRTTVKLLDFGIVKVTSPERAGTLTPLRYPTEQGHMIGTPRFMAPEQILGRACDTRTDVYAAGVLFFLMLSGRDPFHHHRTHHALLTAHVMEAPPRLSAVASQRIPRAVDAAVARALAKDPAHRFGSVIDFGAALGGKAPAVPLPAVTEKMAPRAPAPQKTVPLDLSCFRLAAAPPPRPGPGHRAAPSEGLGPHGPAPTFGLPERAEGVPPEVSSSTAPPAWAAASSPPPEARAARRRARDRFLLLVVVLLWCLVGAVAWRVL